MHRFAATVAGYRAATANLVSNYGNVATAADQQQQNAAQITAVQARQVAASTAVTNAVVAIASGTLANASEALAATPSYIALTGVETAWWQWRSTTPNASAEILQPGVYLISACYEIDYGAGADPVDASILVLRSDGVADGAFSSTRDSSIAGQHVEMLSQIFTVESGQTPAVVFYTLACAPSGTVLQGGFFQRFDVMQLSEL